MISEDIKTLNGTKPGMNQFHVGEIYTLIPWWDSYEAVTLIYSSMSRVWPVIGFQGMWPREVHIDDK